MNHRIGFSNVCLRSSLHSLNLVYLSKKSAVQTKGKYFSDYYLNSLKSCSVWLLFSYRIQLLAAVQSWTTHYRSIATSQINSNGFFFNIEHFADKAKIDRSTSFYAGELEFFGNRIFNMHFIRSKTHMKLILNRKEEKTTWHSLVESRREKKTTVHWTSKRHIIRWFSHTTRYTLFGLLHEKINSNLKRFYRQINWKMKEI